MNIRPSILIPTYNQENFVRETILSVINQTVRPYEVIISDDHSSDSTWDIISEFKNHNPDLIKAYRNDTNLGMFQNIDLLRSYVTGNVFHLMGGDDLLLPDAIEIIQNAIISNNLDPDKQRFIIVTNTYDLFPNGKMLLFNNFRIRYHSPIKERLRYGISYRDMGLSLALENSLDPYDLSLGVFADWVRGFQEVVNCEIFIFIDHATFMYRRNVGITSKTRRRSMIESQKKSLSKIIELFGYKFDKDDLRYIKFIISKNNYILAPSFKTFMAAGLFFLLNLNNFSINNRAGRQLAYLFPEKVVGKIKSLLYNS